jgi:hypothetical protein
MSSAGPAAASAKVRSAFDQKADPIRLTITVYLANRDLSVVNISDVPRRSAMTAH